jgi:hypothetical protein
LFFTQREKAKQSHVIVRDIVVVAAAAAAAA